MICSPRKQLSCSHWAVQGSTLWTRAQTELMLVPFATAMANGGTSGHELTLTDEQHYSR